jgi:hypothetical protein
VKTFPRLFLVGFVISVALLGQGQSQAGSPATSLASGQNRLVFPEINPEMQLTIVNGSNDPVDILFTAHSDSGILFCNPSRVRLEPKGSVVRYTREIFSCGELANVAKGWIEVASPSFIYGRFDVFDVDRWVYGGEPQVQSTTSLVLPLPDGSTTVGSVLNLVNDSAMSAKVSVRLFGDTGVAIEEGVLDLAPNGQSTTPLDTMFTGGGDGKKVYLEISSSQRFFASAAVSASGGTRIEAVTSQGLVSSIADQTPAQGPRPTRQQCFDDAEKLYQAQLLAAANKGQAYLEICQSNVQKQYESESYDCGTIAEAGTAFCGGVALINPLLGVACGLAVTEAYNKCEDLAKYNLEANQNRCKTQADAQKRVWKDFADLNKDLNDLECLKIPPD